MKYMKVKKVKELKIGQKLIPHRSASSNIKLGRTYCIKNVEKHGLSTYYVVDLDSLKNYEFMGRASLENYFVIPLMDINENTKVL